MRDQPQLDGGYSLGCIAATRRMFLALVTAKQGDSPCPGIRELPTVKRQSLHAHKALDCSLHLSHGCLSPR